MQRDKTSPGTQAHFERDRTQVAAFRKDRNLLWNWLESFIRAAPGIRHGGSGPSETLSVGGRSIGETNRLGVSCGSETIALLRELKLAHVDPAGTLYLHLAALPDSVRRRVLRASSAQRSRP